MEYLRVQLTGTGVWQCSCGVINRHRLTIWTSRVRCKDRECKLVYDLKPMAFHVPPGPRHRSLTRHADQAFRLAEVHGYRELQST